MQLSENQFVGVMFISIVGGSIALYWLCRGIKRLYLMRFFPTPNPDVVAAVDGYNNAYEVSKYGDFAEQVRFWAKEIPTQLILRRDGEIFEAGGDGVVLDKSIYWRDRFFKCRTEYWKRCQRLALKKEAEARQRVIDEVRSAKQLVTQEKPKPWALIGSTEPPNILRYTFDEVMESMEKAGFDARDCDRLVGELRVLDEIKSEGPQMSKAFKEACAADPEDKQALGCG